MRIVRLGLTVMLCLGAFWAAMQGGVLPSRHHAAADPLEARADMARRIVDIRRYLPVIR